MPRFALRNPHLIIVAALITGLLGAVVLARMPVDVFPAIDQPAVVVATFYPGMPPIQVERDITTRYERFFTLASGIDHITSRSLPGVSLITVAFQPGTDPAAGASTLVNLALANLRHMPPGTLPPMVLQAGAGAQPVVLVAFSGEGLSETELRDQAQYNVRNFLATVHGASVPPPFGGKLRQIMSYVQRRDLETRGLTLMDVVRALNANNLIVPAGDMKIGDIDYFVQSNAMIADPHRLDEVPVKVEDLGQVPVRIGDVAHTEDASQIQYNVVRINGQRSVYLPVLRQGGANTLAVVDGVKAMIERSLPGVPSALHLQTLFDQSEYVRDALRSLTRETVTATVLATLTVVLFLGSMRAAAAMFLTVVLSLLAAAVGLAGLGGTINIMTLGGAALVISRLVDNAVVVVENVDRHRHVGKSPADAALDGASEVGFAVLASTLTTVIVFLPVVFLGGVAKSLFTALALTVVLAMLASWLVAMTVTPIYCARALGTGAAEPTGGGLAAAYGRLLVRALDHRLVVIGAVGALLALAGLGATRLGTSFFPRTDSGQFTIDFRAPAGSRVERTEQLAARIEKTVRDVIPASDLDLVVSNLGLATGFSAVYSPNGASDSGQVMVSLAAGRKRTTFEYMDALRGEVAARVPEVQTLFQSAGLVDSVLNFGAPAPIDVQLRGPDYDQLSDAAHQVIGAVGGLPEVAQVMQRQEARYPTLSVNVDRMRAARLGLTFKDAVDNIITALTSNAMIAPSVWIDEKTGNDYFLTAQYPESAIRSIETLRNIPVGREAEGDSVLLRSIATVEETQQPAEAAHYDIQRVVDVAITPRTGDLGGAQAAVERALASLSLPSQVSVTMRGAVAQMRAAFADFGPGILLAVVLLYLIMVAQFRSFIDPVIVLFSVPAGLIGVVAILLLTRTTLNIESLMGVIAMIGIAASNAILLVDFANERRRQGTPAREAIVEAARVRLRPILMTSLATIVGFVPIGLNSYEASAPLARAAGGGLACSTLLTLFLVPAVYDLIYGRGRREAK